MNSILNKPNLVATLLFFALLFAAVSQNVNIAVAQTNVATVIVMPTTGGTTDPTPGEYTYSNGTNIVLRAIPDSGYTFSYWIVSGDLTTGHTASQSQPVAIINPDTGEIVGYFPAVGSTAAIDSLTFKNNPTNITCGYGYSYTYTAIFAPVSAPSPAPGPVDAVVIVMPTTGGTVTPAAGRHTYSNGTVIDISATPASGYEFKYWLVSGDFTPGHTGTQYSFIQDDNGNIIGQVPRPSVTGIDSITFTANPAHITCGYGYTYTYTAIFGPVAATTSPTPTTTPVATTAQPTATASPVPTATPTAPATTDWTMWIIIAVIAIVMIIAVVAAVMMRRKK